MRAYFLFSARSNLFNTDNNYSYDELGQLIKDEQENIQHINWRADGKISSIIRGTGGSQSSLLFTYNPMGQRLSKEIYDENDAWVETTYYIRDASGNVMSTYLHKNEGLSETFDLTERHIYGSSRLGLYKQPVSMLAVGGTGEFVFDIPGYRQYELTNHASAPLSTGLGNVTSTITAQKVPIVLGGNLGGYMPQIIQSYDYSPFGVTRLEFDVTAMSTTHPVGDGYRYGFNGMEADDEFKGAKNHYTTEWRQYDPRLGRFMSIDPAMSKFVGWSPYHFSMNSPLVMRDPKGDDPTKEEAAAMSAHVYGDKKDGILKGGWKVSDRDFGIDKTNEDTGFKSKVYERTIESGKHKGETEYTYATAGTEDGKDWANNVAQPFGQSSQYKQSMINAGKIDNALTNGEMLSFTGHSLGGGQAAANAYATDRNAYTFNAAGVSPLTIRENPNSQVNAYIMKTDPLNILQDMSSAPNVNGKRHYEMSYSKSALTNGHSIDNFLRIYKINPSFYQISGGGGSW